MFSASAAQLANQSVQVGGTPTLTVQTSLSSSATVQTGVVLNSQLLAVQIGRFGTLTNDCSLELQLSMDGGSNYRTFKTYSNAQINTSQGVYDVLTVKGTHWRFILNAGTMTGANGLNVRGYD